MSLFAELNADAFNLGSLLSEAFSVGASGSVTATASVAENVTLVATSARCVLYEATLNTYDFVPTFSRTFSAAAEALPSEPNASATNPQPFLDFIETFGLAFPLSMSVGGTASSVDVLTSDAYHAYIQIDADIDSKSSSSFLFMFGSSSDSGGAFSFQEWIDYSSTVAVNYTSCAPTCPPVLGDILTNASAWHAAVAAQPVPIAMSLAPIWLLIDGSNNTGALKRGRPLLPSLSERAQERGEESIATRLSGAASNLADFVTSGAYCALVIGCAAVGGGPKWNRPEVQAARTLPMPVMAAASAVLQHGNTSFIVLAGGSSSLRPGDATATTLVLDTSSPSLGWLVAQPLPSPLSFAAGVVVNGSLWVAGGYDASSAAVTSVVSFSLGPTGGAWSARTPLPVALGQHAMVSVANPPAVAANGTLILVFGGCVDGAACANPSQSIYLLDTGVPTPTWTPSPHFLPSGPSWSLTAVASPDGAAVFVAGGKTPYSLGGTPFLYRYDIALANWDLLSTTAAPLPFYGASAVLMSERLLFIGGVATSPLTTPPTTSADNVWAYEFTTKEWTTLAPTPWPVWASAIAVFPEGPPGLGDIAVSNPLALINDTLPALWLVGGGNDTLALPSIAQLRNLPPIV